MHGPGGWNVKRRLDDDLRTRNGRKSNERKYHNVNRVRAYTATRESVYNDAAIRRSRAWSNRQIIVRVVIRTRGRRRRRAVT